MYTLPSSSFGGAFSGSRELFLVFGVGKGTGEGSRARRCPEKGMGRVFEMRGSRLVVFVLSLATETGVSKSEGAAQAMAFLVQWGDFFTEEGPWV